MGYEMDRKHMLAMVGEYNAGAAGADLAKKYRIPRGFCREVISQARILGLVNDDQRHKTINRRRSIASKRIAKESKVFEDKCRGAILSEERIAALYSNSATATAESPAEYEDVADGNNHLERNLYFRILAEERRARNNGINPVPGYGTGWLATS